MQRRILTFDEQKAAEAAFTGYGLDPAWSPSAQEIYNGILEALVSRALKQTAVELQPA